MIPTLAIDPGNDGAAVLYDGRRALFAWSWREVQRDNRRVWMLSDRSENLGPMACRNLHDVGVEIASWLLAEEVNAYRLAVEGLFLNPKEAYPGGGASLQALSWEAALVAGPLLGGAEGEVYRPRASEWRARILSIPARAKAKDAARAALVQVPLLVPGLGVLALDEHVCEAAAIARDEWVTRTERRAA